MYDNGRTYYALQEALHGKPIALPANRKKWPEHEALEWHSTNRFRG